VVHSAVAMLTEHPTRISLRSVDFQEDLRRYKGPTPRTDSPKLVARVGSQNFGP
jgi:hypothetical protein